MADRDLQMTQRNSTNTGWDNLYPYTKVGNILTDVSVYKLNQDSNGIFTEIQYKRQDGTLAKKSVLSGGTSPEYTTRTETHYDIDGITVLQTKVFTIVYQNGEIVSEVIS